MDIDASLDARARDQGRRRGTCPREHAVLEFVAERIVQVAQESVRTGVPYVENPLIAKLFVQRHRLDAGMDPDPAVAPTTGDRTVIAPTNEPRRMEIAATEQGQSSIRQGLSYGGTNRRSGTDNLADQSSFNYPRDSDNGVRIRGRANEHSFGRGRNVTLSSAEPAYSQRTYTRYQEEPRRADGYIPPSGQLNTSRIHLSAPERYVNDKRPLTTRREPYNGKDRPPPYPYYCYKCSKGFTNREEMYTHVHLRLCRKVTHDRHHPYN
ncbi:hypothetical protein DFP73DRAFT_524730 [Morchella snyderi]|nr:hypothetical protein DFP73DRAFT_524730 [Morchella snyderi]